MAIGLLATEAVRDCSHLGMSGSRDRTGSRARLYIGRPTLQWPTSYKKAPPLKGCRTSQNNNNRGLGPSLQTSDSEGYAPANMAVSLLTFPMAWAWLTTDGAQAWRWHSEHGEESSRCGEKPGGLSRGSVIAVLLWFSSDGLSRSSGLCQLKTQCFLVSDYYCFLQNREREIMGTEKAQRNAARGGWI